MGNRSPPKGRAGGTVQDLYNVPDPGANGWTQPGPKAPPFQVGATQEANQSGANVNGPNGSSQWTVNPDGTRTLTNTLGGALGGANTALQDQIAGQAGTPMPDGTATRNHVIDAMFGQARSRLDPMFDQRESRLNTRLLNQGLDPSAEAYANAMGTESNTRNDAYSQALANAIGMGNDAAQGEFGMNMAARNNPYQQMAMLQGLLQPGMGGALQGAHGPNLLAAMGLQGNYDMNRWQQQGQNDSDVMSGIMDLIKSIIP